MSSEKQWQACRTLLYTPSIANWLRLCSLLDDCQCEEKQGLLLSYIKKHLEPWPLETPQKSSNNAPILFRTAPPSWKKQVLTGASPPFGWELVRCLQCYYEAELFEENRLSFIVEKGWLDGLTHLSLTGCELRGDFLSVVAATQRLPSLTHLVLHGNQLHPQHLYDFLRSPCCQHLEFLDLGACNLHDQAAITIAEATTLQRLRCLRLPRNYLGMEGVYALANTDNLPALTQLSLESQYASVSQGPLFRQGKPHLYKAYRMGSLYYLERADLLPLCLREGLGSQTELESFSLPQLQALLLNHWKHKADKE
jgi:hypothetical protein